MLAEEITLGMRVRYPRTGTTGTILRIEQVRGEAFAELDTTNLLYRIDYLFRRLARRNQPRPLLMTQKK